MERLQIFMFERNGAPERSNLEPEFLEELERMAQKIAAEPDLHAQLHLLETQKYDNEDCSANDAPPPIYQVDLPEMEP